jgi:hypothetical protein
MLLHSTGAHIPGGSHVIYLASVFLAVGLSPGAARAQLPGNKAKAHDCAAAAGGNFTDSSVTVGGRADV